MGGVDLMNSLISLYRTNIRSKKWYRHLVFHLFDLTVVNSWLLYRRDCTACMVRSKDQLSLLKFKAYVAGCLCRQETGEVKKRRRPSSSLLERKFEEKKKRGPTAALPVVDLRKM
jgi:hypothetical protein